MLTKWFYRYVFFCAATCLSLSQESRETTKWCKTFAGFHLDLKEEEMNGTVVKTVQRNANVHINHLRHGRDSLLVQSRAELRETERRLAPS